MAGPWVKGAAAATPVGPAVAAVAAALPTALTLVEGYVLANPDLINWLGDNALKLYRAGDVAWSWFWSKINHNA